MNKTPLLIAAVLLAGATVSGTASAREFDKIYKECGLGAMIFTDTPVAAAFSNIIWDLGTTASSSDMSSPENCKGKATTAAAFITNSYANITEQTIQGEGAHLTAMLDLLGCDEAQRPALVSALRNDLSQEMASGDYRQMSAYDKAGSLHELVTRRTGLDGAQCASAS